MMKAITRWMISAGCLASLLLVAAGFSGDGSGNSRGLISTAQAQGNAERDQPKCSERTVKGTYAFALQGNILDIGPIAASGTTTFNGEGNATLSGYISTRSGRRGMHTVGH